LQRELSPLVVGFQFQVFLRAVLSVCDAMIRSHSTVVSVWSLFAVPFLFHLLSYGHAGRDHAMSDVSYESYDCNFGDVPEKVSWAELHKLLPRMQVCIDELSKLRKHALETGHLSARFNEALFKQYRKMVDMTNMLEGSPVEEYQAADRLHEVQEMRKKLVESDQWRRQLWLPAWKSRGLWPKDFKPDPRMKRDERNLPYLGGRVRQQSNLEFLLNDLDQQESVKMQRFSENDKERYDRIKELRGKIVSGATMKPQDLRELATLEEEEAHKFEVTKSEPGEPIPSQESVPEGEVQESLQESLLVADPKIYRWTEAGTDWVKGLESWGGTAPVHPDEPITEDQLAEIKKFKDPAEGAAQEPRLWTIAGPLDQEMHDSQENFESAEVHELTDKGIADADGTGKFEVAPIAGAQVEPKELAQKVDPLVHTSDPKVHVLGAEDYHPVAQHVHYHYHASGPPLENAGNQASHKDVTPGLQLQGVAINPRGTGLKSS